MGQPKVASSDGLALRCLVKSESSHGPGMPGLRKASQVQRTRSPQQQAQTQALSAEAIYPDRGARGGGRGAADPIGPLDPIDRIDPVDPTDPTDPIDPIVVLL